MIIWIVLYFVIGFLVEYGFIRYFEDYEGCEESLADMITGVILWPAVFTDKVVTEAMYKGWGK